jgi:NADPH2 dehydrogenase
MAWKPGWPEPRALDAAGLREVREAFVRATRMAVEAGFDVLELHAAHGYLLGSFISPLTNRRDDAYGGALEGRMRFPLEVARAVRAVMPDAVPLGARITGSDWLAGGITVDDAATVAKMLKEAGLDFVCVSSGAVNSEARNPDELGYNVPLAEAIRRISGIAVRAVGHIVDPQQADAIVAQGKADMVALARAMLDNPHWGWHAARELGADVQRPPQYLRVGPKLWQIPQRRAAS